MGTATAQCPAAPKPQQYPPPPMPRPGPEHPPPAVLTVAELEAAVAALPGKRDALREAFDRLAACSPSPLPFAWEDLDAHLSSLQWSISLRFLQLRALEAARAAPAAAAPGEARGGGTGVNLEEEEVVVVGVEEEAVKEEEDVVEAEERVVEQEEEEKADEEMQEGDDDEAGDEIGKGGNYQKEARDEVLGEELEAPNDKIGNQIKDGNDVVEEQGAADEMRVANEERSTEDGKKAFQDKEEDANMEAEQIMEDGKKTSLNKQKDANMEEAATKKAPALLGKEQEACGEKLVEEEGQEAHEEVQNAKNTTKEEEKAKKVSLDQGSQPRSGPIEFNDLAEAFASMDARRLVKLLNTNIGISTEFHAAMHHSQEEEEEEKADEEMQEGDDEEAGDKIGKGVKDEDEVLKKQEVVEVAGDKISNVIKDEKDARVEMQVASEERSTKDGKKVSQDKGEEQSMEDAKKPSLDKEEDVNMEEAATKKASAVHCKEREACGEKHVEEEEQEAHKEEQSAKNATKEEEKAKKVSLDQGSQPRPGPIEFNDLAAVFASMDARRLVELIHTNVNVGLSTEFQAAMHHASDGAALSLRVVELFLHDKMLKTNRVWANCVRLIRTVPEVVTKLSTESTEQAKQLAKDWKEMIDNPGSCMALGSLASWGLLYFLISYNIVSEFDTVEIFRLFGTIPLKQQQLNYSVLCKGLGLTDRIPELMDYLIGNGQKMGVSYSLSLLKGYVEKAKHTFMEISQKNMTRQSLNEVIIKELDSLRMACDLAKQQIPDSDLRSGIMAEINALLGKFDRKLSLANASTASTSNPQQQQWESNKKRRKKEEHHHKEQEIQQQMQQNKLGERLEKRQNKQEQEQEKPQEKHQHLKRRRQRTPKLSAWASYAAQNVLEPLRGHYVHPSFTATHGVHHGYPAQPGWPGVHCAPPPAPQLGGPEYVGPSYPFYPHPQYYT
ncbi:unnamed protein product [Urochloa decumbens]|uniref:FRIGIDA-like protein n=1 Tax=Urochloa decumbens TaxID=240449 RepID=A0ABC8Y0F6_9POAL